MWELTPIIRLITGMTTNDFLNSYTSATGAHVKWGLYPYISARALSMAEQTEEGSMAPVIKYIGHHREAGQPITVKATVEAYALPVNVTVLYSVDGGDMIQAAMADNGAGSFTVSLAGIPDAAGVRYQLMATDAVGRSHCFALRSEIHQSGRRRHTPSLHQ